MRSYFLFSLLLCSVFAVQAQKLHAVYEYIPSGATAFREHVYAENGVKIVVRDSVPLARDTSTNDLEQDPGSIFGLSLDMGKNFRRVVIQKNDNKEILETLSLEGVNYLVNDRFPDLTWNTNYSSTDTLGKYVCHKATASYRGTTLIAYYTNSIPVPVGPYKFGGLPGLIVMLYNESANPNYWMLKEIGYPYTGDIPIQESYVYALPKLTLQEYIRKYETISEEKKRILESKFPADEVVIEEKTKARGTVEQVYEWEQKNVDK
ncbi:GLPGLI family protein [Chryseobacterium sp.]|uniref:GLPGLI family protein n=1 Tax=Chryseobacterium sp. TaxID=1871047 RepID=UPI00333FFDA2